MLFLFSADFDFTDIFMSFSLTQTNGFECFDVPITDDLIFEVPEYFNASLDVDGELPGGASLGITQASVRIDDNEGIVHTMQS